MAFAVDTQPHRASANRKSGGGFKLFGSTGKSSGGLHGAMLDVLPVNVLGCDPNTFIITYANKKSVDTLRNYVRDAEMFRDHAGDGLL